MRRLVSLILLFAIAIAAPSFVAASEDGSIRYEKSYTKCPKKQHKRGHLFYGAISKLDLSPKQKVKLTELRLNYKKGKIRAESRIKILEVELKELLLADQLDMDRVRTKLEEIEREKTELRLGRYRVLKEFLSILTPKQRREFRERLLQGLYK